MAIVFLSFTSHGQSQFTTNPSTYTIKGELTFEQKEQYTEWISKANLESFRLKNNSVELIFQEGFTVTLIPGSEMSAYDKNPEDYPESFPLDYVLPVFSFFTNGIVGARITTDIQKSQP